MTFLLVIFQPVLYHLILGTGHVETTCFLLVFSWCKMFLYPFAHVFSFRALEKIQVEKVGVPLDQTKRAKSIDYVLWVISQFVNICNILYNHISIRVHCWYPYYPLAEDFLLNSAIAMVKTQFLFVRNLQIILFELWIMIKHPQELELKPTIDVDRLCERSPQGFSTSFSMFALGECWRKTPTKRVLRLDFHRFSHDFQRFSMIFIDFPWFSYFPIGFSIDWIFHRFSDGFPIAFPHVFPTLPVEPPWDPVACRDSPPRRWTRVPGLAKEDGHCGKNRYGNINGG